MAKKDKAAAKAAKAAGERGSKLDEKREADAKLNLTSYATKAPTDLHVRYADWLVEKLGLEFKNKAERAVFDRAVSVSTALRMPFQRSDENQEANATRAAERATAAAAPKAAKAPKATKAAKVVEEPAEAEAPAEKPAKAAKKAAKKAAPAAEEAVATEAPAEEAKPAAKRAPRKAGAKSKAPF